MTRGYVSAAALRDLLTQLTPRDLAVIRAVSELRFVSGSQLSRMFGDDQLSAASRARAMRRALKRLAALDCLVRLPRRIGGGRSGSDGGVFRLGLAGQRIAIERGWLSAARTRRSAVPGSLFIAHALDVAEVHVLLVEADRGGRLELLERSAEPACWRSFGGIGGSASSRLKPDSFVRFNAGEFEHSVFIEVDRGTEGSRTIQRKLGAYLAYHRLGIEQERFGVFPKVQWLAPTPSRVDFIEAEIEQLPGRGRELFGVAGLSDAVNTLLALD
ncbi:MAG: replication-relaxation family protein [Actinobacteria bacterium]|nr:replication-relaxation family protein [Actinomycetota bacterium]